MYLHTIYKELLLMHGRPDLYFKLHVHGRMHFIAGNRLCTPALVRRVEITRASQAYIHSASLPVQKS